MEEEQRRKKLEEELQEAEDFERSVHVSILTERDFQNIFGLEWKSARPLKVDLSSAKYCLDSLIAPGPFEGLLDKHLSRMKISFVDVSNNRITDLNLLSTSNGFHSLSTVIARHNLIAQTQMKLSSLTELNLSHNQIKLLPSFAGTPNIQVLLISHNQLSGTIEMLKATPRLKRLDVSYNDYDWTPSQLAKALDTLVQCRGLTSLRLYHNPFVACFQEYQIFVVNTLKSLTKLDDVPITQQIREDLLSVKTVQLPLEVFDAAYNKRRQQETRLKGTSGPGASGFPRLKYILEALEEIMADPDPSTLMRCLETVRDNAERRVTGALEDREVEIEPIFWEDVWADQNALVTHLLELFLCITERHDTARWSLTESLGYLTCVQLGRLGARSMEQLGKLMLGGEDNSKEVMGTLKGVVVPTIKSFRIGAPETDLMMDGLAKLLEDSRIEVEVSECLEDLLPMMVEWFKDESMNIQDPTSTVMVKMLAQMTENEEYAKTVAADEEVADKCAVYIEDRNLGEELWLNLLLLAKNLVKTKQEEVLRKFADFRNLHLKALNRAREVRNAAKQPELIEGILRFVVEMMEKGENIQPPIPVTQDCCESYYLLDMLYDLLRPGHTHPQVLGAACDAITAVLKNSEMYRKYAMQVVEKTRKVTPLLGFLGKKKDLYEDLCKKAAGRTIPLPQLDDGDACKMVVSAFLGIVKLVAFFAEKDETIPEEEDEARATVNEAMDQSGRETVLLSLLVTRNDELKLEVMRTIKKVSLEQIDADEIGSIIKCAADVKNISEGKTEEMLSFVMHQMNRFVGDTSKTGKMFREDFAERACAEAQEIFYVNQKRKTSGEDAENEKLELSRSIVGFFMACSRWEELRDYLRNVTINKRFPEVLFEEEAKHSLEANDVAIEQTWTGRSLENLLLCLAGDFALDRTKKVMFRVLARVADVLQGCSDVARTCEMGLSLKQIVEAEAVMWDAQKMEEDLHLMDPGEREDRIEQTANFVNSGGAGRIITQMLSLKAQDRAKMYEEQIVKAEKQGRQIQEAAERIKDRDKSQLAKVGDDPADEETEYQGTGREIMMMAVQQREDVADGDHAALFAMRPESFSWNEDPLCGDEVNPALPIVAVLRALHALLVLCPDEKSRLRVLNFLRLPDTVQKLLALVTGAPFLSCNLAAKFLRVMSLVLDTSKDASVKGEDEKLEPPSFSVLGVMSEYVQRIAENLLPLLKMTKDSRLDHREQTLCVELARCSSVILLAVPSLTPTMENMKPTESLRAQQEVMQQCVEWLMPLVAVRVFIAMVMYALQLDPGAGEQDPEQEATEGAEQQEPEQASPLTSMKEQATQAIANFLVLCPSQRYDVLEVFSAAKVFNHQDVPESFLKELLKAIEEGTQRLFTEAAPSQLDSFLAQFGM